MRHISIDSENNEGNIEGYIVNCLEENYQNFLKDNLEDQNKLQIIINFIKEKNIENILIVKNLNVEEECQGKGIGKSLLEESLEDCDIALLISDKYENQREGFSLDNFYESSDFISLLNTSSGNLMCYPSEFAEDLKEALNPKIKKSIRLKK